MRQVSASLTAVLLLTLAACGSDNSTFPEPTITRVQPSEVMAGEELTITGSNYYAVTGAGNARIEACGITLNGSLVEPVTRTILLPPGSEITARVGNTITGTLPEEGFTAGLSDVRVTSPDGSTAVLEKAVTCVIPIEYPDPESEPDPEPEPQPAVAVITADTTEGAAPLTVNVTANDSSGEGDLTYEWEFGIEDATATGLETSYEYTEAGEYTISLSINDEHDQTDTATLGIIVSEPEPVAPAPPEITQFTVTSSETTPEEVTVTWAVNNPHGDPLTCTFHPGEDNAAPLDLADCASGTVIYTYTNNGEFEATLSVQDEHGNEVAATVDVNIEMHPVPTIHSFEHIPPENPPLRPLDYATFTWDIEAGPDELPLVCTIHDDWGETPTVTEVECGANTHTLGFYTSAEYTMTLTIENKYGRQATEQVVVDVQPSTGSLTGPTTVDTNAEATFEWELSGTDMRSRTCTFNPGDGTGATLVHCASSGSIDHAYEVAGDYTAQFIVDAHDPLEFTHDITVTPASPLITRFTAPEVVELNELFSFDWEFTDDDRLPETVECAFDSGHDHQEGPINLGNCRNSIPDARYNIPGVYNPTLSVTDLYGTTETETIEIHVVAPEPPAGTLNGPGIVVANEEATFTWNASYAGLDDITCSFNPGDGSADKRVTGCLAGSTTHTYSQADTYTATLIIHEAHGRDTEFTTEVAVPDSNPSSLTISAGGLPGGEEPEVTITGPQDYEEITGPGSIILPYAGDYTITAEERVEANVVIPPQNYTYTGAWETSAPTVTVTTDGSAKDAAFQYEPVLTNVSFALVSLPDDYDIYHLDVEITMERVNDQDGSYGPPVRVTTRPYRTEPGLYNIAFSDVTTTVGRADWSWQENYLAPDTTIYRIDHRGLTVTPTYTLETAELTANGSGLPSGLTPELTLRHLTALDEHQPEVPAAQWSSLVPGAYRLEPDVLVDPVLIPSHVNADEVHHPVSGDSNAVYEASSSTITLDSGDDETLQMDYSVKAGLIQVNISAPDGSSEPVVGEVSVLNADGFELVTFTNRGTSSVGVTPGVYEIRIKDVEPEGDSPGYTWIQAPAEGYYVVPSNSSEHETYPVQINVTYEPATP